MKKLLISLVAILFAINAYAQPSTISYQGVLTDAGGTVITGTPNIAFALYDAATNGNQLWTETHNNVTVTNGLFQVELNSVATNWGTANFETDMWLQITVGATTLSPRVKLNANGYSFRSTQATSATSATSATTAATATNIAGGGNGSIPYQTASGTTTMLAAGTNGHVLTLAGGVPTWAAPSGGGSGFTLKAFASLNNSFDPGISQTKIVFDNETVDVDNAFSSGNYTVPSNGLYMIQIHVNRTKSPGYVGLLELRVNNIALISSASAVSPNNDGTNSGGELSSILSLTTGDIVNAYISHFNTGSNVIGGVGTQISIIKIQ